MKIAVVGGAGYVGLITAVGFASLGNQVVAIDVNHEVVDQLRAGKAPIHEDGLDRALNDIIQAKTIGFTTDLAAGVAGAHVVFITVGTPPHADGSPDLSSLRQVTDDLARVVAPGTVVAIKSTVPVGTVSEMKAMFASIAGGETPIVCNPEFLSEGTALHDFFHPSRIVVGTDSRLASRIMRDLYRPFTEAGAPPAGFEMSTNVPYIETGIEEAQIIKYASNAFLATRISFVNELASICEHLGTDVLEVTKGLGMDPRIGNSYLSPGIGFGGPCLEKDLQALTFSAAIHGYQASFLEATLRRNDEQVNHVVNQALALCEGSVADKTIATLGLAFKAGTNDVRTSLSVRVIDRLLNLGATVVMHDPVANIEAQDLLPGASIAETPYEACANADLVLVLTDWPEYRELDWAGIKTIMRGNHVFDGRNALEAFRITAAGLIYHGIGRGTPIAK